MSRRSPQRERRGIALTLALLAIIVIGALVAGGYLGAVQEYRIARNNLVERRALAATELGLDTVYAMWNKSWNGVQTGAVRVLSYRPVDGSWVDTVRITKLNQFSFLVVSEGRAGGYGTQLSARRRAAMLLRLNMAQYNQPGAIVSRGTISIGGNTNIFGVDTVFPGWDCPPAGAAAAGALAPSWSNYTFRGKNCKSPTYACITGNPQADTTSAAADTNTYFNYGNQNWSSLVAMADKTVSGTLTGIQPSVSGSGFCNTSDINNWGDPNRGNATGNPSGVCENYFPIVYSPGDLSINGNVGQGILLVGGNLSIQGNFSFYGQIIVRGSLKLTGTGNHINGGILAAVLLDSSSTSSGNQLSGTSAIQYSRCALNTVFANNSMPARALQRSWVELF